MVLQQQLCKIIAMIRVNVYSLKGMICQFYSSYYLTLLGPMEFSIKLHTIMSEWCIIYIVGSQVIISKKYCISFSED